MAVQTLLKLNFRARGVAEVNRFLKAGHVTKCGKITEKVGEINLTSCCMKTSDLK